MVNHGSPKPELGVRFSPSLHGVRTEEEYVNNVCSNIIVVSPRWNEEKTLLTVEARYTLPDSNVYVIELACKVEKTEGEYWAPEGEKPKSWEHFCLDIPGKWTNTYNFPNNRMITSMLYHLVLPETRRNVLKILRRRYEPLGYVVPAFDQFVLRLEGFALYMDKNAEYSLAD